MKQSSGKLVLLLVFVALSGVSQATPLSVDNDFSFGWPGSLSDNTDYYVSSEKVSWFEANYYCYSKGWELVAPENVDLLTLLKGFRELYDVKDTSYWSAGNQLYGSNWVWGLGGETITTSNWDSNEPNGNDSENCLLIGKTVQSLWSDADCAAKYKFICQKKAMKLAEAAKKCEHNLF
ncbi:C-type lectin domain family 3 member A [Bactrocera oleae]|uniref:C-type lectin domain family 3 member A n=1 Tax=Bactrocera oleae TaxID=104688 RepID=UPI0006B734B0